MKNKNTVSGEFWHRLEDGRVQCDLCPRHCKLKEGQRGLCYVRAREDNEMVLKSYGLSSGYCVDPIEKKPLNHFLPGTPVLSFGTAGCNLSCKFCQNWDISKSKDLETLSDQASPEVIAKVAEQFGCRSVAYTYNDPIIFLEYARDVAQACKERDIYSVAVTAGYITDNARPDFFKFIDAANIDLKAFTNDFYKKICGGQLGPVLDTLLYLKKETSVWFEITTLLIPGENDSVAELEKMTQWIYENLGPDIPIHFSAFHPDYKMRDISNTPVATLNRARQIAIKNGLRYVYTGNVHNIEGDTTFCHHCGEALIVRDWYNIKSYEIKDGACPKCKTPCAGFFENNAGNWGDRRVPIQLSTVSL